MRTRSIACALLVVLGGAAVGRSQYGGRKGDVVLYCMTSKGSAAFQILPPGSTNSAAVAARFEIVDPETRPSSIIADEFDARTRRILHNEPDDFFQVGIQTERIKTPHAVVQSPAKVLLLRGILRDDNEGSKTGQPLDFLSGAFAPFIEGVVVGPDVAIDTVEFLFWTSRPVAQAFRRVPFGFPNSPIVPAGLTGPEYEGTFAKGLYFIPWEPFKTLYAGAGWADGFDRKLIDKDATTGSTLQLLRLRGGRRTPLFAISGNSHLFAMSGQVDITPAGGSTTTLRQGHYAFVPSGFTFRLANPKAYEGPGTR